MSLRQDHRARRPQPRAAHRHAVNLDLDDLPASNSTPLKTCVYRFAQEGLNNAFRHAEAEGQTVRARCEDGLLTVEVSDRGPGFPPGRAARAAWDSPDCVTASRPRAAS